MATVKEIRKELAILIQERQKECNTDKERLKERELGKQKLDSNLAGRLGNETAAIELRGAMGARQ